MSRCPELICINEFDKTQPNSGLWNHDMIKFLRDDSDKIYETIQTGFSYDHEPTSYVLPQIDFSGDYHLLITFNKSLYQ